MKINERYEKSSKTDICLYRMRDKYFTLLTNDSLDIEEIKSLDTPLSVHINATNNCNLNCKYCYTYSQKANSDIELKYDQYIKILDILKLNNIFYISWSGGEPYSNQDFNRILSYSTEKGFVNTILTNLTQLDKIDINLLKHKNVIVQVGLNNIWDDNRTENKILEMVMENYKYLYNIGVNIQGTIMIDHNSVDLDALFAYLENYSVKKVRIGVLIKQGRMAEYRNISNYIQYVVEVTRELIEKRSKYDNIQFVLQTEYQKYCAGVFSRRYELCEAGTSQIYIDCNGNVYPCPLMKEREVFYCGNILKETMQNIWEHPVLKKLRSENIMDNSCKHCNNHCGIWCRGLVYSYTDDLFAKSPFCLYE